MIHYNPSGGQLVPAVALPAHLQVIDHESRLRRRMRVAMVSLGALVLVPVVAAALIPISGAVVAQGTLGAASAARRVSHPEGGVIAWIGVKDGQPVRRGQVLLRFEDKVSSAGASLSALSTFQLLAQRARLEAERIDAPVVRFAPELTNSQDPGARLAIADEMKLFQLRRQSQSGLAAQLTARITGYDRQIEGYRRQISAFQRQGALIAEERDGIESLYKRGLVTLSRRNELERGVAGVDGSVADLTARIGQAQAAITEAREQMLQMRETRRSDAATQLAAVNAELNQQQLRTVTASDIQSRTEIRASVDGVVGKVAFFNPGEVVRPAEPILEIVPTADNFVVEGEIAPTDIDQVKVGQAARVRLSALNQATTPELDAQVMAVAPDRTVDPQTQRAFYKVRLRLVDPEAPRFRSKMTSGMPAEIFVQTGGRSMLSLLTRPLADQFARAFRQ